MPAVARLGDRCSGHGCWPPRPNNEGSPNVFANGIPVHRQGDGYEVHCCGSECHDSVLARGSSSVFVNGKQKARIADPVACGSAVVEGSPNTFTGG